VTPGSFALPATNVSDMYAPRIHGRTAMGRVEIAPR
jgi:alpha-2-macroglobulin